MTSSGFEEDVKKLRIIGTWQAPQKSGTFISYTYTVYPTSVGGVFLVMSPKPASLKQSFRIDY